MHFFFTSQAPAAARHSVPASAYVSAGQTPLFFFLALKIEKIILCKIAYLGLLFFKKHTRFAITNTRIVTFTKWFTTSVTFFCEKKKIEN